MRCQKFNHVLSLKNVVCPHRQMRGETLESLTLEELQQLEKTLEAGLDRVVNRKVNLVLMMIDPFRSSAQIMQQISTLQQKVKEMRCINIESHDLLLLMTFSPSLCFPWCTGVAAGRRKCEAKATWFFFLGGGLQAMEMPNPGKQIMAEKENVVNEDGQSSESVTNALHPGGPQECDDSSVTSLKLGYVSEVNIYAILQSEH
ncbi:hypothetical protein B296_00006088 [Ensete ventricosum]|uniref:K-box domain-containing protein n=1 Tax=Ensete ventricosum TaxID=4639 RepID=A0A426YWH7_ENSVE|nr:hypothetical protein B296_00006088 [Ensete ventricosum]